MDAKHMRDAVTDQCTPSHYRLQAAMSIDQIELMTVQKSLSTSAMRFPILASSRLSTLDGKPLIKLLHGTTERADIAFNRDQPQFHNALEILQTPQAGAVLGACANVLALPLRLR
jgi:hypothetical protein